MMTAANRDRRFLVCAEPLCGEQRRVIRMYGAAADIHEQRTALEVLRESQDRLRLATENAKS